MLWNFIKGSFRSILANKTFTAINILGLAVGITCALIISLYVIHETSFDNFHSDTKDLYRVTISGQLNGIPFNGAMSSGLLAGEVSKEIEEVESVTRITRFGAWLIRNDSISNNEDDILFVDTNFFKFFDGFKLLKGDIETVFKEPRSLVLTESAAKRYFNSTDVVGKSLNVEAYRTFNITGVMEDPPSNTHIPFDMLGSLVTYEHHVQSWTMNQVYTYLRLKDNSDINNVIRKINGILETYTLPEFNRYLTGAFTSDDEYLAGLQNVRRIHLHSHLGSELGHNSRAEYVFAFGVTAILILIIACLNFMNLSSANSINRSKEVILRKVTGAHKHILIIQFLIESIIYSILALIIALLLTEILLPAFNFYLDLKLKYHFFVDIPVVTIILLLTIFFGVISGLYPAIFISSFEPVNVLQGKLGEGLKNSKVRAVFVVFQFFISILIIIFTLVIYSQIQFLMRKDLGFNSEHVIAVRRSDALKNNIDEFKKDLLKSDGILSVSNSNAIPGRDFNNIAYRLKEFESGNALLLNEVLVNYDFDKIYNLEIIEGRFFNPEIPADSFACIINESAAKILGLSFPVGYHLEKPELKKSQNVSYKIIGVVKDFQFKSAEKEVEPLIICLMPSNMEGYINIKLASKNIDKSIQYIGKIWKKYTPHYPFVYFFMNEDLKQNYKSLIKLGRIFIVFSILAIFVASLGLFGLISYVLNQRKREIGIRKSLGASNIILITMLSKETIRLVSFAALFSWIASYFLGRIWLNTYYYHIGLKPAYFIFAFCFVLLIALLTVVYQSLRTVKHEPGVILKYD